MRNAENSPSRRRFLSLYTDIISTVWCRLQLRLAMANKFTLDMLVVMLPVVDNSRIPELTVALW